MSLAREILAELYGMFLADARLSAGILAVVGLAALTARALPGRLLATGAVLLIGCLAILLGVVLASARRR